MARIVVDRALCQGHSQCHAANEDIFDIDDLGFVQIDNEEIAPDDLEEARRGVLACPERALSIED